MSTPRAGKRKPRGSILLLAMFFLIVLFSLSVAFFKIVPAEFHSAEHARRGIQSQFAADAGIRKSVAWLTKKTATTPFIPPADITAYNAANSVADGANKSALLAANTLDGTWSFDSRINLTESDFFRRIYVLESNAYLNGRLVRSAKSSVQNESFAKYALLIDKWNSDFLFSLSPNGIQGPVHTNGFFRMAIPDPVSGVDFWSRTKTDGSPSDPWVNGPLAQMTHAGEWGATESTLGIYGDGNQYFGGNRNGNSAAKVPYDSTTGSVIANRYNKIISGGREKIRKVQEVPLPAQNTQLRTKAYGGTTPPTGTALSAIIAAKGPLLVSTDSGTPNDPNGKVNGGIFLSGGTDASDVQLDITPEGHQKTRVRTGDTVVPGPANTTYRADVPIYRRLVTPDPVQVTVCNGTATRDRYGNVRRTRSVTRADAGRCGTTERLIVEGGISQTIQVPNTCTFNETYDNWEVIGTETYCNSWRVTGTTTPPAYYEDVPSTTAGATQYRTENRVVSSDYSGPGANTITSTTVPGTQSIQNWNSVVEVNDTPYRIPFYSGMKINGATITNSNDPRLTVPDGNTVAIKNDFSNSNGNYAEYTVMQGRINGITFSDNNLKGVSGTNKGSKYEDETGSLKYQGRVIATNLGAGKNIEIRDSILQYYDGTGVDSAGQPLKEAGRNRLKPGNTSPNADHILGLIAAKVDINPNDRAERFQNSSNPTTPRQNGFNGGRFKNGINVYGVILAGRKDVLTDGFGSHSSAMLSDDRLGDFNLFGGIISASSRKTQEGFAAGYSSGFRLGLNYDPVAAEFLENFPSTNVYSVLRYVTFTPNT